MHGHELHAGGEDEGERNKVPDVERVTKRKLLFSAREEVEHGERGQNGPGHDRERVRLQPESEIRASHQQPVGQEIPKHEGLQRAMEHEAKF